MYSENYQKEARERTCRGYHGMIHQTDPLNFIIDYQCPISFELLTERFLSIRMEYEKRSKATKDCGSTENSFIPCAFLGTKISTTTANHPPKNLQT